MSMKTYFILVESKKTQRGIAYAMEKSHQPLHNTKPSSSKPLHIILTFLCKAAVVCSLALVSVCAIPKPYHSSSTFASSVCGGAHDPPSCMAVVSETLSLSSASPAETNGLDSLKMVLHSSLKLTRDAVELLTTVNRRINNSRKGTVAVDDCVRLMDMSVDRIVDSLVALGNLSAAEAISDAHTWLSAVLTNHGMCLDGLQGPPRSITEPIIKDLISRARSSLAVFVAVAQPYKRDYLRPLGGELPSWVKPKRRQLLEARPNAVKADVVVALDGSGKFKTIKEAVAAVPDNSNKRFVIYVKRGKYKEKVDIGRFKKNVMLVGDGMDATIITGNLNAADGTPTVNSATVAVFGDGFMAQDISFQNTAGPQKKQAVALLLGGDRSVINRCKMHGYQDTVWTHSGRQFYRDSYITGTVDFIFGNAPAVFQNCEIVSRKPPHGQPIAITAQGREDANDNTGITIQKCRVIPSTYLAPLKKEFKAYLGRPWKEHSRTVFMESFIDNHIDPSGWSPFRGALGLDTLFYGEYMNTGPGASTAKRVKWKGYHVLTKAAEAMPFTVAHMFQGDSWLKATGVAFISGL
ncbi:hypothetical protein DM860_003007 [Cuscuta australis]|uniref:Pectinesterase n=1 Tax=Cuscuta australis TaxID=267555 RepID=A0A328D222_9ASTE|nr:hypothetical protein DM860_003007 [Cuscuta australis]